MMQQHLAGIRAGCIALGQHLQGASAQVRADLAVGDAAAPDLHQLVAAVEDFPARIGLEGEEFG